MDEKNLEIRTDMGIVMSLINHIENPCDEALGIDDGLRIRYLDCARRILPTLSNPYAIDSLTSVIRNYSD